jgi:hypothetical protein
MSTPTPPVRYGLRHACEQLGFESAVALLESAMQEDCPSVCHACGAITESGHEPDAQGYDCETCGAQGTVNSVLVIAGLI